MTRLQKVVANEAMLWGDDVADSYHAIAGQHIDGHWRDLIVPALQGIEVDMSRCVDFACGRGRNTLKMLREGAGHVTMVDVNQENVLYCHKHIIGSDDLGQRTDAVLTNGLDLANLQESAFSYFHCFDAMVHFDLEIIASYMPEFYRVMDPGAVALLHHSNYDKNPGGDFRANPGMRNFMSAAVFKHLAVRAGFSVLRQNVMSWGGVENIDCITVMRKG
jgi:ubiquinone/menaquinone biosynthesis C-methylase UbiE